MRIGNLSRAGRPAGGHSGRLVRVLALAVAATALLAAWQILPVPPKPEPSGRAPVASIPAEPQPKRQQTAADAPAAPAPRVVYAGPLVTSSAALPGGAGRPAASDPLRSAPAEAPRPPLAAAPEPLPAPASAAVAAPEPVPSGPQRSAAAVPPSAAAPPAPAAGRIDLNAASLEELNAIPGAGLIGRAIVRGRPYASTEDLVTKRVLNRSTFERIKDQIVVP